LLSVWSGQPLKPNRKTEEAIFISEPVVCSTGGIQPARLPELAGEDVSNDGFLARVLLGWPDASPPPSSEAVVPNAVIEVLAGVMLHRRLEEARTIITAFSPAAKCLDLRLSTCAMTADTTVMSSSNGSMTPSQVKRQCGDGARRGC
jgi:hypothetical protein